MPCPETIGHDLRFVDANYLQAFVRGSVSAVQAVETARLQQEARRRSIRLIVVAMPINARDLPSRDLRVRGAIERRRTAILRELGRAGVDFIDLTQAINTEGFSDRWCACGHLNQAGRAVVADRIADRIAGAIG